MPVTLRYIGATDPFFETAITGAPTKWNRGDSNEVGDSAATLLINSGLFEVYADRVLPFAFSASGEIVGARTPNGVVLPISAGGNYLNSAGVSSGYTVLSPDTTLLPTFTNLTNCAAPTITPVTIDGERWLRFDTTATATAADTRFDIAFNTPLAYPVNCDCMTVEYTQATPSGTYFTGYLGTAGGYGVSTNANWNFSATNSQSDPQTLRDLTALTIHRTRMNLAPTGFAGETLLQPVDVCKLRVVFSASITAGTAMQFFLRSIVLGRAARTGRLSIVADDGYASWFQRGVPILERRGIKSTAAIIVPHPNSPGAGVDAGPLWCTTRQLQDYVAAGNACVTHGPHSVNGNLYSGILAVGSGGKSPAQLNAERVADVNWGRDWLYSRGLIDEYGAACYVWPQGVWNSGDSNYDLLDAMWAAGYRLGRSATRYPNSSPVSSTNYERFVNLRALSPKNRWRLVVPPLGHAFTTTGATETANVDKIILAIQNLAASGLDGFLMLHNPVSPGAATQAEDIETDRLDAIAAACQTLQNAGTLECVGMPDLVTAL
jgi:hypothetical protein